MSPGSRRLILVTGMVPVLGAGAMGQTPGAPGPTGAPPPAGAAPQQAGQAPGEDPAPAETAIESYLSERGLRELLAVHLLARLQAADGEARQKLADRLGAIYVQLLDKAGTAEERAVWESKSQELLKAVPEADSFELRLNLGKARYLQAEEIAERQRLRLASPDEVQEAQRVLRTSGALFLDIGNKLNRRVDLKEKQEATGRDEDAPRIRAELADARRLRSLAMYYAGWANYYTAFLSGKPQTADEAISQFGWLLNASGGRQANVERVPASLLKYEHVARAAVGCALCEALRGRDGAAMLWLDAVEGAEGAPPTVVKQIFPRRMVVLAGAKRWNDLTYLIKKRREGADGKPGKALEVGEARLLAVLSLDALQDKSAGSAQEIVQALADSAMTDLITLGEVKHVQDLVTRYGTAPLGGEGFIVQYVRGLQAYDRARQAHTGKGGDADAPATDAAVVNMYREAAASLEIATKSPDGARFQEERGDAGLRLGLALFYAGDLVKAADRFEQEFQAGSAVAPATAAGSAAPSAATTKRLEDALWLAIVSLDKAVEGGKPSLKERLGRLSALYLQKFPKTDRAAKLLLRQSTAEVLTPERAVEILLGVDKESPLYEAARRQAATLLYQVYRGSKGPDRDFAALRFAEVSDEILRMDSAKAIGATGAEKEQATTQILVRVRQVLDAVLGMTAPDLDRAEKAFQLLDSVTTSAGLDLGKVEDELAYRRLQVALARGHADEVTKNLDRLHGLGGRFSDAADRLMYKRALTLFSAPGSPASAARDVVRHGLRVMEQFGRDAKAMTDPAVFALHSAVSEAAARLWRAERDTDMRDRSLEIDRGLVALGNPPAPVLRRYAELAESAGQMEASLDAWRMLLAGVGTTTPEWFEARYNSLRLLLRADPQRAREAMDQYKVLHPDYGPEPWGPKLQELDAQIPARVAAPAGPTGTTGASGSSGSSGGTGGTGR